MRPVDITIPYVLLQLRHFSISMNDRLIGL
jgi:hypothetical protein